MRLRKRESRHKWLRGACASILCIFAGLQAVLAADFTVTTPGGQFAFNINGVNSPTLTLVRGHTYTFAVNTTPGFHPFRINSPGVVNNSISTGTTTYTVPTDATNYTYDCVVHGVSMQGSILTVEPSAPPSIRILGLSVGTNIVLTSSGTNTWSVIPEYTTNLSSTNWFALTVQSNVFANGTNDTFCGRPPGDAVFIRIKA